jgi:hypothetical protein
VWAVHCVAKDLITGRRVWFKFHLLGKSVCAHCQYCSDGIDTTNNHLLPRFSGVNLFKFLISDLKAVRCCTSCVLSLIKLGKSCMARSFVVFRPANGECSSKANARIAVKGRNLNGGTFPNLRHLQYSCPPNLRRRKRCIAVPCCCFRNLHRVVLGPLCGDGIVAIEEHSTSARFGFRFLLLLFLGGLSTKLQRVNPSFSIKFLLQQSIDHAMTCGLHL